MLHIFLPEESVDRGNKSWRLVGTARRGWAAGRWAESTWTSWWSYSKKTVAFDGINKMLASAPKRDERSTSYQLYRIDGRTDKVRAICIYMFVWWYATRFPPKRRQFLQHFESRYFHINSLHFHHWVRIAKKLIQLRIKVAARNISGYCLCELTEKKA